MPLASYKICRLRYTHIIRLLEQLHWIREVRGAGTLLEQVPTRWSSAVAAQLWFAMNAAHVTMHSRTKALSLPLPISLTMRQHNVKPDCFFVFFFWTASIWFFFMIEFCCGRRWEPYEGQHVKKLLKRRTSWRWKKRLFDGVITQRRDE